MLFLRRILIGDNERVLLIRKRRFENILGPGQHWITGSGVETIVSRVEDLVLTNGWADYIVAQRPDLVERYFTLVETNDREVAVIYLDGKLARVIGPARRALFWKGPVKVTFQRIDVEAEPEVPAELAATLIRLTRVTGSAAVPIVAATIEQGKRGLVYVDGVLVRELGAGTYAYWSAVRVPRIEVVETRRQTMEVNGQEILTKDKVSIRVNISAVYEIVNIAAAKAALRDVTETLYRALQVAVRQTLGKRTLEEVLAEKADLDETVFAEVRAEVEPFGVRISAIALKDIVLPGDVRDILNQVVTAEKQAQANLIRRREEVAATRSLLNTAKLLEENPLLVRLKELEALEKIAGKVEKIQVVGGFDALLEKTFTLK